jgi:hypothetical protein
VTQSLTRIRIRFVWVPGSARSVSALKPMRIHNTVFTIDNFLTFLGSGREAGGNDAEQPRHHRPRVPRQLPPLHWLPKRSPAQVTSALPTWSLSSAPSSPLASKEISRTGNLGIRPTWSPSSAPSSPLASREIPQHHRPGVPRQLPPLH